MEKKRYASAKRTEITKLYCDMTMMLLSQPSLVDNEVFSNRMAELKQEIEDTTPTLPSPARKKKYNKADDASNKSEESDLTSIPGQCVTRSKSFNGSVNINGSVTSNKSDESASSITFTASGSGIPKDIPIILCQDLDDDEEDSDN